MTTLTWPMASMARLATPLMLDALLQAGGRRLEERQLVAERLFVAGRLLAGLLRLAHEGQLDLHIALVAAHLAHQAGMGQRLVAGQPVDQLAVAARPVGAGGRQVIDRFQQVRLALAVGADQQADARRQVELQPGVVAEIGQAQVLQMHRRSCVCRPPARSVGGIVA